MVYKNLQDTFYQLNTGSCKNIVEEPTLHKEVDDPEIFKFITGNALYLNNYVRKSPIDFLMLEVEPSEIDNPNIQYFVNSFISVLQEVLYENKDIIDASIILPKLIFKKLEDQSILIEWIFKDFRIGFSIEPNIEESGWYLVSNKNLDELNFSGLLTIENLKTIINSLLMFALSNV